MIRFAMLAALAALAAAPAAPAFLRGADISFLPRVEEGGGIFRDRERSREPIPLLAERGVNAVRVRLWHDSPDGRSSLAEALRLAARADSAGLRIVLDIHYSDTWADPGHQRKPAAWEHLDFEALVDSVYTSTLHTLAAFRRLGLTPAMVQMGNEIGSGILWEDGRVGGSPDTPGAWRRLGLLLDAAARGIREGAAPDPCPVRVLHLETGGDNARSRWFLDRVTKQNVPFEAIGLSFYPWWHGTLDDLRANLADLAARYEKPLYVMETAYPWTLAWYDDTHNVVGLPGQLHAGFPATPQGQRAFLDSVFAAVRGVPGGLGGGVFYWAPEWITTPGFGSAWENVALFDSTGAALPAWEAFGKR